MANYTFCCTVCNKSFEIDIPMKDYDKEKNNQVCPECKGKLDRIIEWHGIAIGSGQGWAGNSRGNVIQRLRTQGCCGKINIARRKTALCTI